MNNNIFFNYSFNRNLFIREYELRNSYKENLKKLEKLKSDLKNAKNNKEKLNIKSKIINTLINLKNISNKTTLGYATITTVLNKLVSRDLITRKKGDLDKRMQFVKITEKGRETIELAPDMIQSQFEKSFQNLHDWEQSMIVACLQRVSFFLEAETIDAAPILDYGELNQPPQT